MAIWPIVHSLQMLYAAVCDYVNTSESKLDKINIKSYNR